jgi:hypothetical protein
MDVAQKKFWSLIVKPEKYKSVGPFHVSRACMGPVKGAAAGDKTFLYVKMKGNDEILVAVLTKDKPDKALDLNFGTGECINFRTEVQHNLFRKLLDFAHSS